MDKILGQLVEYVTTTLLCVQNKLDARDKTKTHIFVPHKPQHNFLSHIESKLKEATTRLEKQLAEEQAARLRAKDIAKLHNMHHGILEQVVIL
ncbi:hypothetical protein MTR_0098s0160 [Medicago truncatula]|uniref:Uncharacterized protein n=1 Tax=Medicago truncatula TaxID=3880 RepID=A0A072TGS2_MEDTR|nr:hypothetical protein MTR_0098s0160 [Medicago truncatula]